ncbi:MAG: TetR/AcrR family transcriptional regulator C-terminal domain-containing protein [Oscillospiraceae bacterium]|nr:TetR/AcrR family transcriptional regulator C-terminal domain-containing protein [Oscillospiraceae bacterium]
MANFTEKAIRAAFMQLLNDRPLSKITVKDISDSCGINRNSFYYHYQDIPSLIQQILSDEIDRIISEYSSVDSLAECMSAAIGFAAENKRAIYHIYNSVNRDMFEQYLWRVCEYTVKAYVGTAFAELRLDEAEREALIQYHIYETFGITSGWLHDGMREDMQPFIEKLGKVKKRLAGEMVAELSERQNTGGQ